MAKIIEYDAKQDKLNPSQTGYSAAETAARREGSFYEQMAQGTREVGRLQDDYDKEVGQQITDFLRFKGLEDAASNVNMRVTNGGRSERTLIGTGTNSGITYAHMNEMANGPVRMSRLARSMVRQNSPLNPNTPVWNNDTQQYESANQQRRDTSYWDRVNQKNMDELNAGDFLHPPKGDTEGNPFAQMQDITNAANTPYQKADATHTEQDFGPGPSDTNAMPTDTTSFQPSPETATDITSGPSNFWQDVATGQTDNSTDLNQGPY